jgi:hypothetical protein
MPTWSTTFSNCARRGNGAGYKLFFSGGKEVMVNEAFDRIVERRQIE